MDIKNLKNLYNQIPNTPIIQDKMEKEPVSPVDQNLMDKTISHLNNSPVFTPKVK